MGWHAVVGLLTAHRWRGFPEGDDLPPLRHLVDDLGLVVLWVADGQDFLVFWWSSLGLLLAGGRWVVGHERRRVVGGCGLEQVVVAIVSLAVSGGVCCAALCRSSLPAWLILVVAGYVKRAA